MSLRNEDIKQLATVAKTLRNNPDLNLVVVGHTDSFMMYIQITNWD